MTRGGGGGGHGGGDGAYMCDHRRGRVGAGAEDFEAAKSLLQSWGCARLTERHPQRV